MLKKYRLPSQLEGEEIIRIVRRDIMVLLGKILFFISLAVLPAIFLVMMTYIIPALMSGEISFPMIVLGASAYYLFVWLLFFFSFLEYYLDVWIITNQRIIYVEQDGFFARDISEQRIDLVQDATSEIHGVLPTIFNYGDVQIQTAADSDRFIFSQVPDPERIRDIIIKICENKKKNTGSANPE